MDSRTHAVLANPTSGGMPGHRAMMVAVDQIGLARVAGRAADPVVTACTQEIGMASTTVTDITVTGTTGRECRKFRTAIPIIGHNMGITPAIVRDPTPALQVVRGITVATILASNNSHL
jgi:hypothetical protein